MDELVKSLIARLEDGVVGSLKGSEENVFAPHGGSQAVGRP